MELDEVYKYAYVKKPLHEQFSDPSQVSPDFLMEWFKDAFDYQRIHDDEEIEEFLSLKPEEIFIWLEEAARFCWEAKKAMI
jgi:hypothetical protein